MEAQNDQEFTDTTTQVSREAIVLPETVRLYADLDLIECKRLVNGVRLFRPGTAEQVRLIYAQRMANRGRKPAA